MIYLLNKKLINFNNTLNYFILKIKIQSNDVYFCISEKGIKYCLVEKRYKNYRS